MEDITKQTYIKTKQAWLITWEWMGNHAQVENKVVAILNYRYSPFNILKTVEQIYASINFTFHEQIDYAKSKGNHPYPAKFGQLGNGGESFADEIYCGQNPYLWARRVFNLEAYLDQNNKEHLAWEERHYVMKDDRMTHSSRLKEFVR